MNARTSTCSFYSDLPSFADFAEITDFDHYSPLPDDWVLLVSDVIQSTSAISNGNYKSVNVVGAASITAVINVSDKIKLPFAFGGDGSLIAVPPQLLEVASNELKRLQNAAFDMFGLELRAAAIPVSTLREKGPTAA